MLSQTTSQIGIVEDVTMKDVENTENPPPIMAGSGQFTNLPRELLSEIAKRLYPLDLIHLARVNKPLRAMFMDSSAAEIWRATLTNVGLPPCPDVDMSEPEYAALMFLKQCTECDEPAGRYVDPIFMVRLCSDCRKYLAVSTETVAPIILLPMLNRSQFLVPPKGTKRPYWYMRHEYEEVDEMYHKLLEDTNSDGLGVYRRERRKAVQEWEEKTKPLVEWVQHQEKERKLELHRIMLARRAEIDARLLNLGWEQADVRDCFYFSDDWKVMVYKSKHLDDADWNIMLPKLLEGLERARTQRLIREADRRESEREDLITKWLDPLLDHLGQLELTLRWKEATDNFTPDPFEVLCARRREQGAEKQDVTIQIPSLPHARYMLKWAPIKELLSQDKPTEEFQLEFERKQGELGQQISGWRSHLEAALVKTLPEAFKPVEAQSSQFNLKAVQTKDSTKSSDSLSTDLRTLLRADAIFKYDNKPVYYPDAFTSWMIDPQTPIYDPASSTVAKAILKELQCPNALYLEMRALGRVFLCGRCTSDPTYLTWQSIVSHFVYEQERWKSASRWNERYREEAGGITLVFTHDKDDSSKPLVQLVAEADQISSPKTPKTECKVCLSIGQHYRTGIAHIAEHTQATHLIERPVQGEHYT